MHSPHTLRRGNVCFSIRATDQPALASRIAADDPAGPAPMMSTSKVFSMVDLQSVGRKAMAKEPCRIFTHFPPSPCLLPKFCNLGVPKARVYA